MIKELAIISGKGGTGKTSIAGSLAFLAKDKIMVDCDVDAADLHLILNGKIKSSNDFIGSKKAEIVPDNCLSCGTCAEYCRFDAVKEKTDTPANDKTEYNIDKNSCEGCGVCYNFCPNEAIEFKNHISGKWYISDTKYGPLVHAKLGIAEANSGKLVSLLRKTAHVMAEKSKCELIIIDGPPGIGCPVIASLTGVDYVLIITEPTVSAIHDMERLLELTGHFGIKTAICINKYDINKQLSGSIDQLAKKKKLNVLARIPYDINVTKAQIEGIPYSEYTKSSISKSISRLWQNLKKDLTISGKIVKCDNKELIQLDKPVSARSTDL